LAKITERITTAALKTFLKIFFPGMVSASDAIHTMLKTATPEQVDQANSLADEGKTALWKKFVEPAFGNLIPDRAYTIEEAEEKAWNLAKLNLGILATGWLTHAATEALSLGQYEAFDSLHRKIDKAMMVSGVTGLIMAAPIRHAVLRPLGYSLNKKYRTILPDVRQCIEARSRYLIDDAELLKLMDYHGLMAGYEDWWKEFANTPLRYFALAAIARSGLWDKEFFTAELKRSGYAWESIEVLLKMYEQQSKEEQLRDLKRPMRDGFREGFVSEEEYRQFLKDAMYSQKFIDLQISLEKRRMEIKEKDLTKGQILRLYREKIYNREEALQALKKMHYTTDAAQLMIKLEDERLKQGEKALSRADVLGMYRSKLIEEDEARRRLQAMGYRDEDIELMLQYRAPEEIFEERVLSKSDVLRAFKAGILDEEKTREKLTGMGFDEEDIDILIALYTKAPPA